MLRVYLKDVSPNWESWLSELKNSDCASSDTHSVKLSKPDLRRWKISYSVGNRDRVEGFISERKVLSVRLYPRGPVDPLTSLSAS